MPEVSFSAKEPDMSALRLSFAPADVGKLEEGVGRLAQAV